MSRMRRILQRNDEWMWYRTLLISIINCHLSKSWIQAKCNFRKHSTRHGTCSPQAIHTRSWGAHLFCCVKRGYRGFDSRQENDFPSALGAKLPLSCEIWLARNSETDKIAAYCVIQ